MNDLKFFLYNFFMYQTQIKETKRFLQKIPEYQLYLQFITNITLKTEHYMQNNKKIESLMYVHYQFDQEFEKKQEINQKLDKDIQDRFPSANQKQQMLIVMLEKNPQIYKNYFDKYFCKQINLSIRNFLWVLMLNDLTYIQGFKKVDKKVLQIPQFQQDFYLKLNKIEISLQLRIIQTQKIILKRLLQAYYRISKETDISIYYLCFVLIKSMKVNFDCINKSGGYFFSLVSLGNQFSKANSSIHLEKLYNCLNLIDQQSLYRIKEFNKKQSNKKQFVRTLKSFFRSFGSCYLSLAVSSFLIDNMLILRKNKMSIYIMFSIVIMILFSQEDSQDVDFCTLIQTKSRNITIQKFRDVCTIIYSEIDITVLKTREKQMNLSKNLIKQKTAIYKILQVQYEEEQRQTKIKVQQIQNQKMKSYSSQEIMNLSGIIPILAQIQKL